MTSAPVAQAHGLAHRPLVSDVLELTGRLLALSTLLPAWSRRYCDHLVAERGVSAAHAVRLPA